MIYWKRQQRISLASGAGNEVATSYRRPAIHKANQAGAEYNPSDDLDEAEEDEDYEVIPYQRAALWMGFFIVLCAAALKYLHL